MCYVQIAGMLVATLVTLVVVPVLYVIFVEDLHLVRWETESSSHQEHGARKAEAEPPTTTTPSDKTFAGPGPTAELLPARLSALPVCGPGQE
jgi:hypothetical protein